MWITNIHASHLTPRAESTSPALLPNQKNHMINMAHLGSVSVSHLFILFIIGLQGWCSAESTHLPPVWPRFDSQIWCHVGSVLSIERFSPGPPVSLSAKTSV